MQASYLQNVRYKLQKRYRRLNEANHEQYLYALVRFWAFFDQEPILRGVAEELSAGCAEAGASVERIFKRELLEGSTEEESAAIGYGVLRRFAEQDQPLRFFELVSNRANYAESLDEFRTRYLRPFYDYLDEHLDDRNFVLFALVRYKWLCEWFERDTLFNLWTQNLQRGEKNLALHLYRSLFEQGIDFQIEPWSVSGEADMVASQTSEHPLIADAKIFNPEKSKGGSYIRQAFHQIYRYTCDYNQPIGYLVIFNTSEKQLSFDLKNESQPVPRITFNNKTVFFLEIDIFPHPEPASRRKPGERINLTEQEIIEGFSIPLRLDVDQSAL
jgi:hypothetical protein